jgi:two-component system, OmpR family, catabolic regulation response regulator CreB
LFLLICLIALDQIPRDRLYEFGQFRLSTRSWTLEHRDQPLHISKYEFVLLLEFLEQPQAIIPRSYLVRRLWPADPQTGERALSVYVYRLNRILGNGSKHPRYIQGVRGMGYRLRMPVRVTPDSWD